MGENQSDDLQLEAINAFLYENKKGLLLLLDEYHTVYSPKRCAWRTIAYCIPNMQLRPGTSYCISAVLTGSSAWLYSLAYGFALVDSPRVRGGFEGYHGRAMNINRQRYTCRVYNPISAEDLPKFIEHFAARSLPITPTDEFCEEVYFYAGLNIGQIERYLSDVEYKQNYMRSYCISHCPPLTGAFGNLLASLHNAQREQLCKLKSAPSCADLMTMVAVWDFEKKFSLDVLHEEADAGAVYLDEEHRKVGFSTPLLAAYVAETQLRVADCHSGLKLPEWLTMDLRRCLEFPFSADETTADAALRFSIAEKHRLTAFHDSDRRRVEFCIQEVG